MAVTSLHEVVSDMLRTDTALLLAGGPSASELALFLDGLADVQVTLDDVRAAARERFTEALNEAPVRPGRQHGSPPLRLHLPTEAEDPSAGRRSVTTGPSSGDGQRSRDTTRP